MITNETLKKIHDDFAATAVGLYNECGDVTPQLFIFGVNEEGTPQMIGGLPPKMMNDFFENNESKDKLAFFMQDLLSESGLSHVGCKEMMGVAPDVLVQINEAWVLEVANDDAAKLDFNGSIADDPERRECVMVQLHTRESDITVMHKIIDGKCIQSPFSSKLSSGTGRFSTAAHSVH